METISMSSNRVIKVLADSGYHAGEEIFVSLPLVREICPRKFDKNHEFTVIFTSAVLRAGKLEEQIATGRAKREWLRPRFFASVFSATGEDDDG
jgi:hypothetical protein